MISYRTGNLLESEADALVNTVNTVGVMGKGIALMFREAFPENFQAYAAACKLDEVQIGRMFVTHRDNMFGPKLIINFPTKKHWRHSSKLEWIKDGLIDLKNVIRSNGIRSVALPPLGAGNGGLEWSAVRPVIEEALADLSDVAIIVYEPTKKSQNVAKRSGVDKLTPARALIAEMVRRYWVLGTRRVYPTCDDRRLGRSPNATGRRSRPSRFRVHSSRGAKVGMVPRCLRRRSWARRSISFTI